MTLKLTWKLRTRVWCAVTVAAIAIIFLPMAFEDKQKLPQEWAEEINIPALPDNELELAELSPMQESDGVQDKLQNTGLIRYQHSEHRPVAVTVV